ncbi:hypothetical protein F4806DRAFT_187776 [Annulohypoxylon nitens]|nr:hypothetical protein F4806DRAFT_187776 [Annulohypoxylon nitens]
MSFLNSAKNSGDHSTIPPTLPDNIFYYLTKSGTWNPRMISRLSRTCRRLSELLDPLLYRADVLETQQKLQKGPNLLGIPRGVDPRLLYAEEDLVNPRMTVKKLPALHWAANQANKGLGSIVAQKSMKAAQLFWPSYIEVLCEGIGEEFHGMAPLHLAAISGNQEIVQNLLEARAPVDTRVIIQNNCRPEIGDLTLSDTIWSELESPRVNFLAVNPLGLSIMYGHHRIAETLAELTKYSFEVVSPLGIAVLHKMPSVVRTLLSRGYNAIPGVSRSILELAIRNDGNEEVLQLLAHQLLAFEGAHFIGVFQLAIRRRCVANLLFLVKYVAESYGPTFGPMIFSISIDALLRTDELLPVVKELLDERWEFGPAISMNAENYLRDNVCEGLWVGRGLMIQKYLLYHSKLEFSNKGLRILLKDLERRTKHREWMKTLPEEEQERIAGIEEDMLSEIADMPSDANDLVSRINRELDAA